MFKHLFILWLFLLSSLAIGQDLSKLETFLGIDRFHSYMQRWSLTMAGRDKKEIAGIIMSVSPEEIQKLNFQAKRLSDPFEYDGMILEILRKKNPALKLSPEDVAWNYNFYKRKLAEAYAIGPTSLKPAKAPIIELGVDGKPLDLPNVNLEDQLLNVDGYVAGRTTRGVFWEASVSNRPIELHVGSAGDFRSSLAERGAKIIGQVKTVERNYNPIYLIQVPGEKEYRYAITEISGADRVKHFAMQAELVKWNGPKVNAKPVVNIFGDAKDLLAFEEMELTNVLKNLPKADRVVIGQKGAFERTLSVLAKNETILEFAQKNSTAAFKNLSPAQQKLLIEALKDPTVLSPLTRNRMKVSEDIYEALLPLLEKHKISPAKNFTVFNLDRGSYEMSDYLLTNAKGETKRWRIFSNSWGDEVLPKARALKATGHTDIIYIGTAGAMPNAGLKVGDLVIPENAISPSGNVLKFRHSGPMPEMAKEVEAVINVASPFEETHDWLEAAKKQSQVVEIETAHLASVFNSKTDKVTPYLLVSDIVGVEGETLAEASAASSKRVKAQESVIAGLLEDGDIRGVTAVDLNGSNSLAKWIDELAPNKDPVSRFQSIRKAELLGIESKADFAKFLKAEPSFTTARLEVTLKEVGKRFESVMEAGGDYAPRVSLGSDFLNGSWNAGKEPVSIHLQVSTKKAEEEILQAIKNLKSSDKKFGTFLDIQVSRAKPGKDFIRLKDVPSFGPEGMLEIYKDSALGFGGLASTETRTGSLKFIQVNSPTTGKAQSSLAYFAPDEKTAELLSRLKGNGKSFLESEIKRINDHFTSPKVKVNLKMVDELKGGNLAQIVPDFTGGQYQLNLFMTKQGVKNPAVVMEEIIHLQQITEAYSPWTMQKSLYNFNHPYQWAELVANSKAGSLQASQTLARLELEAAIGANDALEYFQSRGLIKIDADMMAYLEARKAHAEKIYAEITKQAKLDLKVRTAKWEKSKKIFDKLEGQKLKLNDLVAKNDRKGVKKLIEKYLPWDIMEPSERKAWQTWLEAIETPNPKNSKLVFRGLADDLVMKADDGGVFFMSTVLTKNQGSYTRRLRSLATLREKFGTFPLNSSQLDSYVKGAKNPTSLTTLMVNHSIDPKGSPFLSVASLDSASSFASGRYGAFRIDERRLLSNAVSGFDSELERLVPLIIFPDEVVAYKDFTGSVNYAYDNGEYKDEFVKIVEEKLGRKVTAVEKHGLSVEKFKKQGLDQMQEISLDHKNLDPIGPGCSLDKKGCDCLFSTLNSLLK